MRKFGYYLIIGVLLAGSACRKEVEKLVVQEVDKQYSWAEVKHLINYQRNVMRVTTGTNTLNLQLSSQPKVMRYSCVPMARNKSVTYWSRVWGV